MTHDEFELWLEENAVEWGGPGEVVPASDVRLFYEALTTKYVPIEKLKAMVSQYSYQKHSGPLLLNQLKKLIKEES